MLRFNKALVFSIFSILLGGCETTSERNQRLQAAAFDVVREKALADYIYKLMDRKEISLVEGYTRLSKLRYYSEGREEKLLMNFMISAAHQADLDGLTRSEFERKIDPQLALYTQQLRLGMRESGGGGTIVLSTRPIVPSAIVRPPISTTCNNVGGITRCTSF